MAGTCLATRGLVFPEDLFLHLRLHFGAGIASQTSLRSTNVLRLEGDAAVDSSEPACHWRNSAGGRPLRSVCFGFAENHLDYIVAHVCQAGNHTLSRRK